MALFITLKSTGDKQAVINATGSGGLEVDSFFRRANTNESPTAGAIRTGDGEITVTSLRNRVPFDITVQTKDGGGSFSPASNVLLVTPRAAGTSDYDAIRLELQSQMLQVTNIGKVHTRIRHLPFWESAIRERVKDGRWNAWEITRSERSQDLEGPQGSAAVEPTFRDIHTIVIRGIMALKDEDDTETTFHQIVDDIVQRIQLNQRLNGAVLWPKSLQVPVIEHEMIGDVLCHVAELEFAAWVRVES